MIRYSKQDLLKLSPATGLKAKKIPINTTIIIIDLKRSKLENGFINDCLLCDMSGKKINIPIREYIRFTVQNGDLYDSDGDLIFPNEFVIVSSSDRRDRTGDVMYPIYAYNAFEDQSNENRFDYIELKESGIKEGNKYEPVQDYVISFL